MGTRVVVVEAEGGEVLGSDWIRNQYERSDEVRNEGGK